MSQLTEDLEGGRQQEVNLALFPECYLQGYAPDRETIVARSLTLDNSEIRDVLSALERYPTTIILGLIQRRGASFLNSALVIREGDCWGLTPRHIRMNLGLMPDRIIRSSPSMIGCLASISATTPTFPRRP